LRITENGRSTPDDLDGVSEASGDYGERRQAESRDAYKMNPLPVIFRSYANRKVMSIR